MRSEKWMYDRTWAEVDLDAIRHNMKEMRRILPEHAGIIGVVKADGYGHGAGEVAECIAPWVWGYAVASVDEGLALRDRGIKKPILMLGPVWPERYEELIRHEIRPVMFRERELAAFGGAAAALGLPGRVHLAVDTGMNRIGMEPDEESAGMAARAAGFPGLKLEGLFTHFARADEADQGPARAQLAAYARFVGMLSERGVSIPVCHCANSAGIIGGIGTGFAAVRAGISIYGLYPSGEVDKGRLSLLPALEWKARITYIKDLEPGEEVSYGGTFTADRPMRAATVAAGYGDGYPRSMSGTGYVLIRGKRARILGRVCMDQFMADVTDIPEAGEGDVAVLLGTSGDEILSAETFAALSGGYHYEVLCGIGKRVPRVYRDSLTGGKQKED